MTRPRVLLVEDDATTRAFLIAAIGALPADVEAVASCAEARAAAARGGHALWLLDACLPDGDGASLLKGLRDQGLHTPALAHTAARERPVLEALVATGFAEALVKPISTVQLHAALRRALGTNGERVAAACEDPAAVTGLPVWDDAAALSALYGQHAHVGALRQLFLDELPGARDAVAAAVDSGSVEALKDALHKLRASCGFVGAARLGGMVSLLQLAVDPRAQLDGFLAAVQDTLSPL